MIFDQRKYTWLAIALVLLTFAYVLMSGPANSNPQEFDENIFSFRRITLAPMLILGTYIGLVFLILKKPKNKCSDEKQK
jgi:hypothetical protein